MALPTLSQIEQLRQLPFMQPTTSVAIDYANSKDDDEDLDELITDPELSIQKRLIEALFLEEKEKEDSPDKKKEKDEDTVTISAAALELYRRYHAGMVYENDGERLEIQYERVEYLRVEQSEVQVQEAEPLVIDLNGNGIELTDVRNGEGVAFDITGDGRKERVSWVSPSDGILVYDRNGNGIIDSGKELFGDQHGAANGFEELAKFDTDNNSTIDKNDSIYNKLNIWQDLNQNGYSEATELKLVEEYGIESIDLNKDNTHDSVAGNRIEGYSRYQTAQYSGRVGEVYFNYLV